MEPKDLYQERIIKLISFSIGKRKFTVSDALNASGMGVSEFLAAAGSVYSIKSDLPIDINLHEVKDWHLKPEALFGYMGLKEFEHSVKSAKEAKMIAIASIIITALLALGSIIVPLVTK